MKGTHQQGTASPNVSMAQAMCVEKAPDTLQIWESKRKPETQEGIAALTAHVMITLCIHEGKEEAGSSQSLLDAAHGDGTTGRLFLGVHMQAPSEGSETALSWDGAAARCPTPRSCRKSFTFLRDLLVLQGHEGAVYDLCGYMEILRGRYLLQSCLYLD